MSGGDWRTVKIGETCDFLRGLTYKKTDEVEFSSNAILRANNIALGKGVLNFDEIKYISDEIIIPEPKFVKKNSILICTASGSKSHLGKTAFIDDDYQYAFGGFMGLLIPKPELDGKYLYWVTASKAYSDFIAGLSDGANINNLKFSQLSEFSFSIPPLKMQKRIVAILDEAFAGIDTAIANTEKNLANARELFESVLNSILIKRGKGWEDIKLDDACIVERGSSPRPIKAFLTDNEDGVNWVKIGDTKGITKYIKTTKQKITQEGALRSRRVDPGDFILTNSMSFGRPYIMATTGYIHDGWFVLRIKEHINTDYFYHLLSSRIIQEQFGMLAAGAVVKNISSDLVKRAVLPIPPMDQQVEIVKTVELLSEQIQILESIYERKLTALAELKQSLLQKAFSGELTAEGDKLMDEAVA